MVYMPKKSTISLEDMLNNIENLSQRDFTKLVNKYLKSTNGHTNKAYVKANNKNIENHLIELGFGKSCPNCGSKIIVKKGRRDNGVQRLKCTDCNKQFTFFTDTILEKTKYTWDMWVEVIYLMMSNTSLVKIRNTLEYDYHCVGITEQTVFNWRMKILDACKDIPLPILSGVIEADETFIHEGQKGSLKLIDPLDVKKTRKARKTHKASKYGTMGPEFANIACCIDRTGHLVAQVIGVGAMNRDDFDNNLATHLKDVTFLCSDANSIYEGYCRDHSIPHYIRPSNYLDNLNNGLSDGKTKIWMYNNQMLDYIMTNGRMNYGWAEFNKVKDQFELSLAHVNQIHSRIKLELVAKTKGISLKNIPGYMAWQCLLVNYNVDYGHVPVSHEDAEEILKLILKTKRNTLLKEIKATEPDFSHLQKAYVNRLIKATEEGRKKKVSAAYYITSEEYGPNFNKSEFLANLPVYMLKFLADQCGLVGRSKIKKNNTYQARKQLERNPYLLIAIQQLQAVYGKTKES